MDEGIILLSSWIAGKSGLLLALGCFGAVSLGFGRHGYSGKQDAPARGRGLPINTGAAILGAVRQ